jgi:hypothetical protein
MSLLDLPRCPNCNTEIDLKELWRAAPKTGRGGFQIEGHVGVVCPTCGIKLRVLQAWLQVAGPLLFAAFLGFAFLIDHFVSLDADIPLSRAALLALGAVYFGGFAL